MAVDVIYEIPVISNYGKLVALAGLENSAMIYLTVGIKFGGIYKSQVAGVFQYLNTLDYEGRTTGVSFIPVRNFFKNRKEIKDFDKSIIVLPVFFKSRFVLPLVPVLFILCLFSGHRSIIGRGVTATRLGLMLKKAGVVNDVIYDGRGAYLAELEEYGQVNDKDIIIAREMEREVVINSNFRLAVSQHLVKYWNREYNYRQDQHIVIPCTTDQVLMENMPEDVKMRIRKSLGLMTDSVVLVYSGAAQAYQSFFLIDKLLSPLFSEAENVQLLLLSNLPLDQLKLARTYPDRVVSAWLKPQEVMNVLSACDYGLLFREGSVTNQVAAPTKFVEYLAAGLQVMISDNIGDYSAAVDDLKLGIVAAGEHLPQINLVKVNDQERLRIKSIANQFYTKVAFQDAYMKLLDKTKR